MICFDWIGVLLQRDEKYAPDPLVDQVDVRIGRVTDDRRFMEQALQDFELNRVEWNAVLEKIACKYQPFNPIWALLPELKKRYRLGVINNGTHLTFPWFGKRFEIDHQFDLFLSSGQAGCCKPEAGIYYQACQKLKAAPGECLFMDDMEDNVRGASAVGMRAIHWPDPISGFRAFQTWLRCEAG